MIDSSQDQYDGCITNLYKNNCFRTIIKYKIITPGSQGVSYWLSLPSIKVSFDYKMLLSLGVISCDDSFTN